MAYASHNHNNSRKNQSNNNKNFQKLQEENKILADQHDSMGRALINAEVRLVDAHLILGKVAKPLESLTSGTLDEDTRQSLLEALADIRRLIPAT